MAQLSRRTAVPLLAAALLVLLAAVAPTGTLAAPASVATAIPTVAAPAVPQHDGPLLPAFEQFFAQTFRVSVMTQSYGTFNATLRMRSSLNFPEKVQGELIPLGEQRRSNQKQTLLPHFERPRGIEDDKLSDFLLAPPSSGKKGKSSTEKANGEFAMAGEGERPTLLVLDLQLQHSDAVQGTAHVYYLPADLMALRAQRAAMSEGAAPPSASVDFAFRPEVEHMTGNPLSDVNGLARVSSAVVHVGQPAGSDAEAASDAASTADSSSGGIVFRWISEHEFSAQLTIPASKAGTAQPEHVWLYGYAPPSKGMFDRKQRQVPWYNKYLMIGVGVMGFVLQIVMGVTEGKKRAQETASEDAQIQAQEQAKLEMQLKEQERNNKKK